MRRADSTTAAPFSENGGHMFGIGKRNESRTPGRRWDERINDRLREPDGQTFVAGKWRFFWLAIVVFQCLNSGLTAIIFKDSESTIADTLILSVVGIIAILLCWLSVGHLHYSDGADRRRARVVSGLDSTMILFAVLHLGLLLWVWGHSKILQRAWTKYESTATDYNDKAMKLADNNVKIVEGAEKIAKSEEKKAQLENDTAYQTRKAAEAGAVVNRRSKITEGLTSGIETSKVELEKPEKPEESPTAYLARMDGLIRITHIIEMLLSVITLIYIRTRSAKTNTYDGSSNGYTNPRQPGGRQVGFAAAQDDRDPKA
jgi:hypothetical protein